MSKVIEIEAVTAALNVLATLLVALRCISRFGLLKKSLIDDYLVLVAVILSWSLTGLIYAQIPYRLGQRHNDSTVYNDIRHIYYFCFFYLPIYDIALTVTRLSALTQFLRFFFTPETRGMVWALIVINSLHGIIIPITAIFSCHPIESFWESPINNPKCINLLVFWYINAAFNIIADITVVFLPLYELKDLNLPKGQTWALRGIFTVGGITCICSVIRLHKLHVAIVGTDATYVTADLLMWSSIEVNTAITCACIQPLKPLIQKIHRFKCLTASYLSSSATAASGSTPRRNELRSHTVNHNREDSNEEPMLRFGP